MNKLLATSSALALAIGLLASTAAYAGPAVTLVTPGTIFQGTPYVLGFEFTVVRNETITALGVYDDSGLSSAASIGLWDTVGNLLTSATVPAGAVAPVIGDFIYASIAPFTAVAGTDYIVGSYLPNEDATSINVGQGGSGFFDSNVIGIEDRYNFNATFSFPRDTVGASQGAWLGANFLGTPTAMPEPASLALLGAGLVGIGLIRRKRVQ